MAVDRSRLPEVGPDPSFRFPRIVRHQLANGLAVRTVEHRTVPLVTFVMQIDGGSGGDPPDKQGLAGITADMLDEGTGTLSALDVSDAFASIGAELDVDVAPDATTFSLTALTRFADRGASLLADILTMPSLREDDFVRVRQLRLDRLRQLRDVPAAVAERVFLRLLYGDHPYAHLSIGADRVLRTLELDEVRAFHRATYRPSSATLVVAGDMRHEALSALAERAFGAWGGPRERDARRAPAVPAPPGNGQALLAVVPREKAAQSELRIGQLTTNRNTPDYSGLLVLNAVLGGQFVSRVNLKLREEKGYTYGARTAFDWRRGISPFSLHASVHTAATADAVSVSLKELEDIRGGHPVDDREMLLARATLTRGYPRGFETVQNVARFVAQLALYDLPDTYFEEFVPRVSAVSPGDVTRVARTHLDPSRMLTLVVGDEQAIADSLKALHLGDPVIVSADQ